MVEFERPISNRNCIYNIRFATRGVYTQAGVLLRRKVKTQKGKKAKGQKGKSQKGKKEKMWKLKKGDKENRRKWEILAYSYYYERAQIKL